MINCLRSFIHTIHIWVLLHVGPEDSGTYSQISTIFQHSPAPMNHCVSRYFSQQKKTISRVVLPIQCPAIGLYFLHMQWIRLSTDVWAMPSNNKQLHCTKTQRHDFFWPSTVPAGWGNCLDGVIYVDWDSFLRSSHFYSFLCVHLKDQVFQIRPQKVVEQRQKVDWHACVYLISQL